MWRSGGVKGLGRSGTYGVWLIVENVYEGAEITCGIGVVAAVAVVAVAAIYSIIGVVVTIITSI